MAEMAKWYIIHTYSGYENKVAQTITKVVENRKLHDLICEVSVPTEKVTEVVNGKKREIERKIYPGYVLVKMICNDDSWYVVKNTRGVTGFVGPGSEPTPLTDEEVAALGIEGEKKVEINIAEGDTVQVIGTAMDGFVGTVKSVNIEDETVDIIVSMFGRETPATLSLTQVAKMDY
ncbi:MAG: transcription termination/antitermination protein NusG [Oscillospiraceae bacterium]|nr:transcription termination/antitermination protein NusG [Oscillospiraceae bacterium]MDD6086075.1 transcription termination/antitermination protein NusG [Oscillospiraceae bacterium]MDY3257973.1 transcription termination/antitermination protein NusG [Ruminococcus callidus]